MELTYKGISEKAKWEKAGIVLPSFDIDTMVESTKKAPKWIHFGAGNIFRGFIAELQNKLLNSGVETSGIIASDTFDLEIIDQIYVPYDNLTLLVGLKPDGNTTKSVLASVAESVKDFERLKEIFAKESLQMVSFTITEKGYALTTMSGELLPIVKADIENGIHAPKHAMSLITALMYERYQKGAAAISLVSMDNCSHNGEKLQSSILQIASSWQDKGFVPVEFVEYLKDDTKVAFPWTMIDKITPRPAKVIEDMLVEVGVEDMSPITTSKNTFIAPFVNAEIPQYLVIEDKFPNGRPMLEKAGVYFTDRDTVNDTEKMKVTTCLNPLHTALAVYGCLLGYDSISSEMKDECLRKLVMKIGYDEGLPVVIDPGILSPMKFIKEVIEERLPNPFVPDMPQRIDRKSVV